LRVGAAGLPLSRLREREGPAKREGEGLYPGLSKTLTMSRCECPPDIRSHAGGMAGLLILSRKRGRGSHLGKLPANANSSTRLRPLGASRARSLSSSIAGSPIRPTTAAASIR
jgi:hypothetical protein